MANISNQLSAWRESVGYAAPKTSQQIQSEMATMTFEQLRIRAGPPPNVNGCDFSDSTANEKDSGGGEQMNFDSCLSAFKRGLSAPPAPLYDDSRPEARNRNVTAYNAWWNMWGRRLCILWNNQNKNRNNTKTTSVPVTYTPTNKIPTPTPPRRPQIAEVSTNSGW